MGLWRPQGIWTPGLQAFHAPRVVAAAPAGLLLDSLTATSIAAYSTRKLRTGYAGAALRVKRSSDNAESDIGFTGNDLDTSSLLSFCGAGNGIIVTWYDQSGNGNNATSTMNQIVTSGSLTATLNSKPSIQIDVGGSNTYFATPAFGGIAQPNTYAFVIKVIDATQGHFTDGISGGRNLVGEAAGGTVYQLFSGFIPTNGGTIDNDPHGLIAVFNGASSVLYEDNSSIVSGSDTGGDALGTQNIGANASNTCIGTQLPEYIIFNGQSISAGDRAIMTANWAAYWATP